MLHNAHPDCLQHTVVDLENHLDLEICTKIFQNGKFRFQPPPRETNPEKFEFKDLILRIGCWGL